MLPGVVKLLPGQTLTGWTTFAPKDDITGDLAVLVGSGGNVMMDLNDDQVAARVPLEAGQAADFLDSSVAFEPALSIGDSLGGGAVELTLNSFGQAENPKQVEAGNVIYVAELDVANETDGVREINKMTIGSLFYVIDADGNVYAPTLVGMALNLPPAEVPEDETPEERMKRQIGGSLRMASWPDEVAAGDTVTGMVAFEVPESATLVAFVGDTGLGYSLTREGAKLSTSPIGAWKVAE